MTPWGTISSWTHDMGFRRGDIYVQVVLRPSPHSTQERATLFSMFWWSVEFLEQFLDCAYVSVCGVGDKCQENTGKVARTWALAILQGHTTTRNPGRRSRTKHECHMTRLFPSLFHLFVVPLPIVRNLATVSTCRPISSN